MQYCGVLPPRDLDPTWSRSCLKPPHFGGNHESRGMQRTDEVITWPNEAMRPTVEPEQAAALATSPQKCPKRESGDHHLIALPLLPNANFGRTTPLDRVRLWATVKSGRVCRSCWDFYDPRPQCEEITMGDGYHSPRCTAPATYHELDARVAEHWRDEDTEMRWYCGRHAPSKKDERADRREAKKAIERAEMREKYAPEREQGEAENAIFDEALRWRDDEQATEGFCDDESCEHHECRLARAVTRVERAREAVKEARASR